MAMAVELPASFLERMNRLLEDEFEEFMACYQNPAVSGLRVNSLKIEPEDFLKISPFSMQPVRWCPEGFQLQDDSAVSQNPGKHVFHTAGLYYLQDPSAMAAASILSLPKDALVLDLAAAPGGKTTHLASLMQNQGTLIANEIHPKRVWDLAENLERCGVINAVVIQETPEKLAAQFGAIFDLVLVDAPCSGEGMFRKSEKAIKDWSPELVQGCAARQMEILKSASKLIRPGGFFLYSTCTFSVEENEKMLGSFLESIDKTEGNFKILNISRMPGFSPGIPAGLDFPSSITNQLMNTVRLWPHRMGAEGHFLALIQRSNGPNDPVKRFRPAPISFSLKQLFDGFVNESLNLSFALDRVFVRGNYVYLHPERMPDLTGLKVIHPGWWLGTMKKNRFEPSHAMALGLKPMNIKNIEKFKPDSTAISGYLRGETIRKEGPKGWTAIGVEVQNSDVFIIGWGKRNQDIIKNFYPRGLRRF